MTAVECASDAKVWAEAIRGVAAFGFFAFVCWLIFKR